MRNAHYSISAHILVGVMAVGVAGGFRAHGDGDGAPRPGDESAGAVIEAAGQCHDMAVPVSITLSVDEQKVMPGAHVDVEAVVDARGLLAGVHLALSTEGPVQLAGPAQIDVGAMEAGESRRVLIPVIYPTEGRSVLRVDLQAQSGERDATYEKHEALYVILEGGRATSGMGEFLRLDLRRLEEDLEAGLITEEEAKQAARELTMIPGTIDEEPRPFEPPTEEQEALARGLEPVADPNETFTPDDGPVVGLRRTTRGKLARGQAPAKSKLSVDGLATTAGPSGNITVQGTVTWLDENGASHAAFGITVQVRDDELIGSELVTQGTTDVNGQYSFVVDNDDGIGAGNRDIFVRFRTANSAVSIESAGLLGAPYEADTAVMNEVPDNTVITENFTCANTGTGPSCGLTTGATYVAAYAKQLNGGSWLSQIVLEWPGDPGSANYDGSDINLRPGDRWDWDVMFHEYGHYVTDTFNFTNNPGGAHNIGDCISVKQGSKDKGTRMAWAEGWPTFFGTAGQQQLNLAALAVPRVGDVIYADTGESNFSYSLEAQDSQGLGEDNEVAVQRILWDLFDGPADSRDTVQVTDQSLFDTVNGADPTTLSAAWAALRVGLSNAQDLAFGAITTDHQVGPQPTGPGVNAVVTPATATFTWVANVGCSSTFAGNNFDLVFYDATTLAKLLTLPGVAATMRTLSLAEFQGLVGSTHKVRWAVEGRNTSSPATGPFLGDNRACTLDQPPVCNADGPYQPECAVATMLNGSGSSDPDGDPLTFAWSGAFSGGTATGAMPSVVFPAVGNSSVSLTVSDGFTTATCSSSVMVRDTLPPVIPPDVVAECTSPAGTPVNIGVPTDLCDPSVSFVNDAPALFPLGATPVMWTATDDSGNVAMGTQTVTVVDTTPPVLTLSVSPDILWPPNHTLRTVQVAVSATDACDSAPVVRLESITSSEPDSGTGPHDKANDIQGAAFGTDDRKFRLRAEHAPGTARAYTITYSATDSSGNTTMQQVVVRVPKSRPELVSRGITTGQRGQRLRGREHRWALRRVRLGRHQPGRRRHERIARRLRAQSGHADHRARQHQQLERARRIGRARRRTAPRRSTATAVSWRSTPTRPIWWPATPTTRPTCSCATALPERPSASASVPATARPTGRPRTPASARTGGSSPFNRWRAI